MFGYGASSTSTQPILLIHAGPTLSSLKPVPVNHPTETIPIENDEFLGLVCVKIVNFKGPDGEAEREWEQFPKGGEDGKDGTFSNKEAATWSITVQGKFKQDVEVSDLMWGNIWAKPIKDRLPPGTSVITKYMVYRDPAVSVDLQSDTPHAFSPWLSTTQFVTLAPHPSTSQELPPFDPTLPVQEDITSIFTSHEGNSTLFKKSSPSSDLASWKGDPKARKDFFGNSTNSEGIVLSNDMVVLAEFAHGHIDFSTLSLKLPLLPSLPLAKYWDGQPITFVLRNKKTQFDYLYVTFEIAKEEETASSSGSVRSRSGTASSVKSTSSGKDVVKGGEVE